jgi:hypothetical protein
MDGSHLAAACVLSIALSGCAVIKTTDVTDASYKRHQSFAVLGWPLYTRITDQEQGTTAQLASKHEPIEYDRRIRAAELLGRSLDLDE